MLLTSGIFRGEHVGTFFVGDFLVLFGPFFGPFWYIFGTFCTFLVLFGTFWSLLRLFGTFGDLW